MNNSDHSNSCETCLWHDQCGTDRPCDNFSPVDQAAADAIEYLSYVKEDVDHYLSEMEGV